MTREEAREAGKRDPKMNTVMGVFAVMRRGDEYTYGIEDTSIPKTPEEAQERPVVVERWIMVGFHWQPV